MPLHDHSPADTSGPEAADEELARQLWQLLGDRGYVMLYEGAKPAEVKVLSNMNNYQQIINRCYREEGNA